MSTFKVNSEPSPVGTHETGKKRASRISLDYFKHGTFLGLWKNRLSLIGLLLALVYVGYVLAASPGAASRGPVAGVHAAWDSNCQACHANFAGVEVARLWGASAPHQVSDAKCQNCHLGTVHHASAADATGCGNCHRDHRGRDASLVRLGDSDCTGCHANLGAHLVQGKQPSYSGDKHQYPNRITSFATDHPAFNLPRNDPGQIQFNHVKHLAEGQDVKWTLGQIKADDPVAYERYRNAPWQTNKDDSALVVLKCASCHVLDAGDEGVRGTKSSGAYFQPISYDLNCKACHSLSFDANLKSTVKTVEGNEVSVPLQAPHGVQPQALDPFLWGVYADAYLNDQKNDDFRKELTEVLKSQHQPSRPLPGKGAAAARQSIDEQVAKAKSTLLLGIAEQKQRVVHSSCAKCHFFEGGGKEQQVKPSGIPVVWQTHARFSHVAHRAMDCKACHAEVDKAKTKDSVMLPQMESCRECHAPASARGGGVRHDCTGCHLYHNGDHAREGIGAAARNPGKTLTIQEFLRGHP